MLDRALLVFGMVGAFRRSELMALHLADVEWVDKGLRVSIRRSKTDQDGAGATVAIPKNGGCGPRRCSAPKSAAPRSSTATCSAGWAAARA